LGDNYQLESLGADVVVKVVEKYLADYRDVLRVNFSCQQALTKLLDVFVDWPQAHRLTYRLDEIFR
jgi:hypothetical protein